MAPALRSMGETWFGRPFGTLSVCLPAFLSVRAGGVERQAAGPAVRGVLVLVAGRAGGSKGRSPDLLLIWCCMTGIPCRVAVRPLNLGPNMHITSITSNHYI